MEQDEEEVIIYTYNILKQTPGLSQDNLDEIIKTLKGFDNK